MHDNAALQRHLELYIGLFKFYFEMATKINIFVYGITGAIFTYFFANSPGNGTLKYSLIIPLGFSLILSALFIWGALTLKPLELEIEEISNRLKTYSVVTFTPLKIYLLGSAFMYALVVLGSLIMLFKP